jgi:hypothetical protein
MFLDLGKGIQAPQSAPLFVIPQRSGGICFFSIASLDILSFDAAA